MVDYSDFSLGKKKDNIKINIDDIKGGIKSDAIEKDLYSIFKDAVNTDGNNILDRNKKFKLNKTVNLNYINIKTENFIQKPYQTKKYDIINKVNPNLQ